MEIFIITMLLFACGCLAGYDCGKFVGIEIACHTVLEHSRGADSTTLVELIRSKRRGKWRANRQ